MNEGVTHKEKELKEINKEKEKVKPNKKSTAQESSGDIKLDTNYKKIENTQKWKKQ